MTTHFARVAAGRNSAYKVILKTDTGKVKLTLFAIYSYLKCEILKIFNLRQNFSQKKVNGQVSCLNEIIIL